MSGLALGPEVRSLARDAAEWRLLGLLFERPRGGWGAEVERVAREVEGADLAEASRAAGEQATEPLFIEILGPGGCVSPREVGYRRQGEPGALLADLKAAYDAFAYEPLTEEPPDHVAVLAGFVGFLRLKEAFARAAGEPEAAAVAADAARHVCEEHLARLADPMLEKLRAEPRLYLTLAARALRARVGPSPQAHVPEPAEDASACVGCAFE